MGYWGIVKKVVEEADIIVEVLDARFPEKSMNTELENMAKRKGKQLVFALNKADLVGKASVKKFIRELGGNAVFLSAGKREGIINLRKKIGELAGTRQVKVGVVGYPNVGKSSIINALGRKKRVGVSARAGFTRGTQYIRVTKNIVLIDSPGVLPPQEQDETLLVLLSAKNVEQLKDIESTGVQVAEELLKAGAENLCRHYGVDLAQDGEGFLEKLALKRKKILRGGKPDLGAAARILIGGLQKGGIKVRPKTPTKT